MKNGTYITKQEHNAICYAIDFLSDAIGSAGDKPAKQIDKNLGHLISLRKKSKKQPLIKRTK